MVRVFHIERCATQVATNECLFAGRLGEHGIEMDELTLTRSELAALSSPFVLTFMPRMLRARWCMPQDAEVTVQFEREMHV